jgi:superfamily II DNA/RNA helicase
MVRLPGRDRWNGYDHPFTAGREALDVSVDHAPTFRQLRIDAALVRVLDRAKITVPTPVQAAVLPDAMSGRDVLGRAATGSGKTLAFGLPVLARLAGRRSRPKSPRGLVVVPTRELAAQVRQALDPLADAIGLRLVTVYGGTPYDRQIKRLKGGADIVVATPGRLQDLVARGACKLDDVEVTVLDEADHLCDLGFFPAVSEIVSMTRPGGQRMLMSATLDGDVDRLVRLHLTNPVTHICNADADQPDIDHHVLVTAPHDKVDTAAALLRANPRSIVFTRTRMGATRLAQDLAERGVTTVDLHGNLSQGARERNLRRFRTGRADVVVATDVAARGIHVDGVNVVVHYDLPAEQKSYLHRSGRTARAGSSGAVVIMTTSRQLAAVTGLHRAVGVVARHHDGRTAPDPMTVAALALVGEPIDRVAASSGRSADSRPGQGQSRRGRGQGQPSRAHRSGSHDDRRQAEPAQRPRGGHRPEPTQQPERRTESARAVAPPAAGRERPERRPDPRRGGAAPRTKTTTRTGTKARWTGAQRRAAAKR